MDKKAISPLIATVLLLGFVVAIGVLVWLWYGSIIQEQVEKTSARSTGEFICASEVDFTILNACYKTSPEPIIEMDLENRGSVKLDNFRVRVIGSNEETITLDDSLGKAETKETSLKYNITNPKRIIVFPVVVEKGVSTTCSEKGVEIEINACS